MKEYDVIGFDEYVPVRFTKSQFKQMKKIIKYDQETYENKLAVFIRASVIKNIRSETKRLKIRI